MFVASSTQVKESGITAINETSKDADAKKMVFVSFSSVPTGCVINKAGIIATDVTAIGADEAQFTAENAKFVRGDAWTGTAYRYTWTKTRVEAGAVWYVRAYLIYTDANGNTHTVYGEIVTQTM